MSDLSVTLHAHGMHCHGCEHIIEVSLGKIPGVGKVKADYPTETVKVSFDDASTSIEEIRQTIEKVGYRTFEIDDPSRQPSSLKRLSGLAIGIIGILLIILLDTEWISQQGAPDVSQRMSLGLIFMLGLLTGFHCVGMCGGFVLSYTADDARLMRRSYLSHLLYAAGKTLSYTLIGATFGLLGAFIAFTPLLRGVAGVAAGAFLIIFGLNMLGLFAPLRRFRLGLPTPLQEFLDRQTHKRHRPFAIGLLNGLMIACGPLQAMYVMAAGTGSALEGAKMLFAFGVGALPVLLSFGVLATLVSSALTHRLLKASGAIVVVLGAVMINRGLILTGAGYDLRSLIESFRETRKSATQISVPSTAPSSQDKVEQAPVLNAAPPSCARPADQTIEMDVIRSGFSPNHFVLTKGIPVKWAVNGKEITHCNKRIVVPILNLEFDVRPGRQIIEFTPEKIGVIPFSCWMGMLRGDFQVVEEPPNAKKEAQTSISAPVSENRGEIASEKPPPAIAGRSERYTIMPGDTLTRIAGRIYHDARKWREIAHSNPGLNPRRLQPGQTLSLLVSTGDETRPCNKP